MRRIVICLMILGGGAGAVAQNDPSPSPIFQVGEQLRYSVKWKFIRLGTITMTTVSEADSTSQGRVQVVMDVESSRGLPVVDLRERNEAVMDIARMRSLTYVATHDVNGHHQSLRHTFAPEERSVTAELTDGEAGVPVTTILRDVEWYVEGVTLFFYAREAARRGGSHTIPTLVNQAMYGTSITIAGRSEEIEIDAVDYPIRSKRLFGEAEWTGSAAGVTGEFMGWVSDDEASVMLRAELEIFLGSIDIELEQWRRAGWQPPSPMTAAR